MHAFDIVRCMKATTVSCKTCGQLFVAVDPRRIYCSAKCNGKAQKDKLTRIRDTLDPVKCWQCGTQFKPYSRRNHFCTEKCKTTYGNEHKSYKHVCVGCGTKFTSRSPKTKYCTRSCALRYTKVAKTLTCVDCGELFEFIGRTRKRRCDKCHHIYWNDYYADAMADRGTTGWSLMSQCDYNRTKVRLSAEHRAGYRAIGIGAWGDSCLICGAAKDGKKTVDVHHVDGDLRNIHSTNLIPLCRKCHGQVHSIARDGVLSRRITREGLKNALFSFWPEGRSIIGSTAQQCAEENTANSENAKLETGLANAELGTQVPSVETIHGAPATGEDIVRTTNIQNGDVSRCGAATSGYHTDAGRPQSHSR